MRRTLLARLALVLALALGALGCEYEEGADQGATDDDPAAEDGDDGGY